MPATMPSGFPRWSRKSCGAFMSARRPPRRSCTSGERPRMKDEALVSIVVPVFREAENLLALHERVRRVLEAMPGCRWELILVNDGSDDASWETIKALAAQDPRIVGIDLSRNFGKEIALSAGVEHARG